MLLVQIFGALVMLFVKALLAVIVYPMWIAFALITSPIRIFSAHAHSTLVGKAFGVALHIVFMRGANY